MLPGFLRAVTFCAVLGIHALVAGGASVNVLTRPDVLEPGENAVVNCHVIKTVDEPEQRIVVRVDLHNAVSGEKVSGTILDNGGAGYKGKTVNVNASVPVPADAVGSYYFQVTAAPWSFNRAIVEKMESYPVDGTFTYKWLLTGGYGVTQDVWYKGTLVAPSDHDNTCYCSGLAFEVFVLAWNEYNEQYGHTQIGDIPNASVMSAFRRVWYGNYPETEKLATRAIPEWGVGVEIVDWEEAQKGDACQLWRHSGSGHNPIFVNWRRNSSGEITGVRYWGSQGTTNGIGYAHENFGTTSNMNPERFYLARAKKPRDQADYDWALGMGDTSDRPSVVNAGIGTWAEYE